MTASADGQADPTHRHAPHDHAPHDHGGERHDHGMTVTDDSQRRVFWVMIITGGYMFAQAAGGYLSGSLALIADAGHMLSDTVALFLSWMAFQLSRRPPDESRTFGYHRFQVLAALANGATLFLIAIWVVYEAIERFSQPVEVLAGPMLAVAVIGLCVNIGGVLVLRGGDRRNVNMRGALLHVFGDLPGSVAGHHRRHRHHGHRLDAGGPDPVGVRQRADPQERVDADALLAQHIDGRRAGGTRKPRSSPGSSTRSRASPMSTTSMCGGSPASG